MRYGDRPQGWIRLQIKLQFNYLILRCLRRAFVVRARHRLNRVLIYANHEVRVDAVGAVDMVARFELYTLRTDLPLNIH